MDLSKFQGHTPGPWMVDADGFLRPVAEPKRTLADIDDIPASDAELIRCAPELLDELASLRAEVKRLEGQVALLTVALANAEAERDSMRAAQHISTTGTIALDAKEGT